MKMKCIVCGNKVKYPDDGSCKIMKERKVKFMCIRCCAKSLKFRKGVIIYG